MNKCRLVRCLLSSKKQIKTFEGAAKECIEEEGIAKEVCVVLKAQSVSCWRLNGIEVQETCRSAKCECEQQCQWEPGAADVSLLASISHPCFALRGGGESEKDRGAQPSLRP